MAGERDLAKCRTVFESIDKSAAVTNSVPRVIFERFLMRRYGIDVKFHYVAAKELEEVKLCLAFCYFFCYFFFLTTLYFSVVRSLKRVSWSKRARKRASPICTNRSTSTTMPQCSRLRGRRCATSSSRPTASSAERWRTSWRSRTGVRSFEQSNRSSMTSWKTYLLQKEKMVFCICEKTQFR